MLWAGTVNAGLPIGLMGHKAGSVWCVGSIRPAYLAGLDLPGSPLDLVLAHLARQRVAVDAEDVRRLGHAAVRLAEHAHDEALLELAHGVVEPHALIDHFLDEPLESVGDHSSSRPVSRRNASTYLSRVFRTTSSGSDGTGGCLFHLMRSRESRTNCLSKLGCGPPGA